MFNTIKSLVSPIQARCTIVRGNDTYEVALADGHICSELILYKMSNQRKLFKRAEISRVIMEVLRADASRDGVDVNSVNGLVNLAEYFVDEHLKNSAHQNLEAVMKNAQLKAFNEHRG